MNDTLFDCGCEPDYRKPVAADATRRGPTCWEYCELLDPTERHDLGSVVTVFPFRLCRHESRTEPEPIFQSYSICEHAIEHASYTNPPPPPEPTPPPTPPAAGWEDY